MKLKMSKKSLIERIVVLTIVAAVVIMLAFFLKDIFVPLIKYQINGNKEAAETLLRENGILGYIAVPVIEALQMVVIFIPAEFIQITSGMSFPWWVAILLCDLGVCLGASFIYLIINVFRFKGDILGKSESKIAQYEKVSKNRSTLLMMVLLFIMPIIPFGAIAYYGSSKKPTYWKYILTVALAVLPSICTSILMGAAITNAINGSWPIWAVVLVIIGGGGILLFLLLFILHQFFFKHNDNTPYSWFYGVIISLISKFLMFKVKYKVINQEMMNDVGGQYVVLANHHTWFDFMGVHKLDPNMRYAMVMNAHLFHAPIFGKWFKRSGCIPKKLFAPDIPCAVKILNAKNSGYSIAMFPEARLSTDGGASYINTATASLAKKLDLPVVLVQLRGGYFIKPKWRKKMKRGTYEIEVKRIIQPSELENMSVEEVHDVIQESLSFNEFDNLNIKMKSGNKAKGLENILYRCKDCGELYSTYSKGNYFGCSKCGKKYEILPNYQFKENNDSPNIHDYYQDMKKIEMLEIDKINLDVPVDVKIYTDNKKKFRTEKGMFHFDKDKVYFKSSISDLYFEYSTSQLEGIAYSVNEEFEMYYNDELYYFYPDISNRKVCTRIALLFEANKMRLTK